MRVGIHYKYAYKMCKEHVFFHVESYKYGDSVELLDTSDIFQTDEFCTTMKYKGNG